MNQSQIQCHYCLQIKDKNSSNNFLAKCCIKRCNKQYCIDCIKSHFNSEYESYMYRKDTWICYFCQGVCNCQKCKRSELTLLEKKQSKKKQNGNTNTVNQPIIKQNAEQSIEQSFSHPQTNNKHSQSQSLNPSLSVFEIENKIQINQSKPKKEFQFISQEQISKFPIFMKPIIERKNIFYNFVLKKVEQSKIGMLKQKFTDNRFSNQNLLSLSNQVKVSKQASKIQKSHSKDMKYNEIIKEALREHQHPDEEDFEIID